MIAILREFHSGVSSRLGLIHVVATIAVLATPAPVDCAPAFSDANWTTVGSGVNGAVYALAVSGNDLYVGGSFTNAGGFLATNIAKWDGSSWSALGSGVNGSVSALAVSGSDLYVAGAFTNAGGIGATHVAKWDGSNWSALGSGTFGQVFALASSGSHLYAGGNFDRVGGVAGPDIAEWNGISWTNLGSGVGYGGAPLGVFAMAVSGSDLYAGGMFRTASGVAATNIAKWNGSSWTNLGLGVGSFGAAAAYALAASSGDLYVGGVFANADGIAATNIAKWNGSSWSALGSGVSGGVAALAVSGSDLYVGGANIAKWDGSGWSALGSGVNGGFVYAVAVSGNDLYAGGTFTMAGGKPIQYIARAYLLPLPALSVARTGPDVQVSWPSADTDGFGLEQANALAPPVNWVSNSASVSDDGTNKSVTVPATNSAQFFRLRRS